MPLHPSRSRRRRSQTTLESQPGHIYWLPAKDQITPDLLTDLEIEDGCFNHPVIVLFGDSTEQKATILIVRVPPITEIPSSNFRESLLPSTVANWHRSIRTTSPFVSVICLSSRARLIQIMAFCYASGGEGLSSARKAIS